MPESVRNVSVIIPTRRRPESLRAAVESVLAQTAQPWEIVVVDDNADLPSFRAASLSLAASAGERVRVVEHDGAHGGAAARNAGAESAYGDFFAFLDDDDRWLPRKLEYQMKVLGSVDTTATGLIYTGLLVEGPNGNVLRSRRGRESPNPVTDLARQNYIGTVSSALVPRHVFDAVGGFDPSLPARQDLDLWIRIAQRWQLVPIPEPLTVYVNHDHGISKDFEKKMEAYAIFLEKHRAIYDASDSLLADYRYSQAGVCIKHQRLDCARKHLWESLRCHWTMRAAARLVSVSISSVIQRVGFGAPM